jgi:hypothetical protein
MVTSCKADHIALARTHMWVCPCYSLYPVLKNNKKIPKWNRRARMDQFVGFSYFHSSTVVLVCNLHTGHISLHYQAVFSDKFETVFSNRWSSEEIDKICDSLFAGNCECYVKEEYNKDSVLVCEPLPLDMWLSKPKKCDCLDTLKR